MLKMKKRMIAILLAFVLTISSNAIAWAAPEEGTQDSTVSEEVENSERVEEIEIGIGEDETSVSESEKQKDEISVPEEENGNAELNNIEPQTISAESKNNNGLFAGGTGTAEDPYQITTAEQMNNVRNDMSAHYVLTNDIDLSGYNNWVPIGTSSNPFTGTFDGNNHSIIGMTITNVTMDGYTGLAGMFGNCKSAFVKNMQMDNISIEMDKTNDTNIQLEVGCVVAKGSGDTIITNCKSNGKINISACRYMIIGGISGVLDVTSEVISCTSNLLIIAKAVSADSQDQVLVCGGICGSFGNVTDSINYSKIDVTAGNVLKCGGICGEGADDTYIIKCINYGDIIGKTDLFQLDRQANYEIGGIIGKGGSINTCVNYGNLKGESKKIYDHLVCSAGGISGASWNYSQSIKNCYNLAKNIEGTNLSGNGTYNYTRICANAKQIDKCYSIDSTLLNGQIPTDNIGVDKPNGANLSEEEIIRRIDELFENNTDDDTDQESNARAYIKEHIDFINGRDYAGRMDNCWAKTISQGLDTTTGKIGETMYNTLNSASEILSCKSLSIFENPYDAVITELILAQANLEESSFEMKYENSFLKIMSELEKICEKADPEWSLKASEYKTNLEKLISNPKDYQKSNPVFYELCEKIFSNNSNSNLNDLLNKYGKANDLLNALNTYGQAVNWVADCIKYNALVEAYLSTSDEFKQSLKDAVVYMAGNAYTNRFTSYESYCMLYAQAYEKFAEFQTEDQIKMLLFKEYVKNGIEKIGTVFGSAIVKNVTTYATEKLGIPIKGASWFWAAVESYKIGWGLSEAITKNGTNIDCRELARAYFYLEEAFQGQVKDDASKLKQDMTHKRAIDFHASYTILKNLECSALKNYAKYLNNQQMNFLQGVLHLFKMNFNEKEIMLTNYEKLQWENVKCHGDYKRYKDYSFISICCPTDVFVYDSVGQLAFCIEKNEITSKSNNIEGIVIDNMKFLVIPDISDYTIKIIATDNGIMNYQVNIYDAATDNLKRMSNYLNVELQKNDEFTGSFKGMTSLIKNGQEVEATSQITDINNNVLVSSVLIESVRKTLNQGDKILLKAKIAPENATFPVLNWTTSNENVATVDENGMVTAVAAGKCTIQCIAIDGSGIYDTVELEVRANAHGGEGNENANDTGDDSYIENEGTNFGDDLNSDGAKKSMDVGATMSIIKKAPNTGDEIYIIIWAILALCGVSIITILFKKRETL